MAQPFAIKLGILQLCGDPHAVAHSPAKRTYSAKLGTCGPARAAGAPALHSSLEGTPRKSSCLPWRRFHGHHWVISPNPRALVCQHPLRWPAALANTPVLCFSHLLCHLLQLCQLCWVHVVEQGSTHQLRHVCNTHTHRQCAGENTA